MKDLIKAINNGDLKLARFLIRSGSDLLKKYENDGYTALHYASWYSDFNIVKLLIECDISNTNTNILEKDNNGFTALHRASQRNNVEIIKLLIRAGSDISEKTNNGLTALHLASYMGHLEVVKLLVESGSDIDDVDRKGKTAIDVTGREEIKEFLMEQLEIQKNGGYVLK